MLCAETICMARLAPKPTEEPRAPIMTVSAKTALGLPAIRLIVLRGVEILSAAPWRKQGRKNGGGAQIDLLVQTPKSVYVVEIKRRNRIGDEVIEEVRGKLERIRFKGRKSIRTALVYCGELAPTVRGSGFFDFLISGEDLLK